MPLTGTENIGRETGAMEGKLVFIILTLRERLREKGTSPLISDHQRQLW